MVAGPWQRPTTALRKVDVCTVAMEPPPLHFGPWTFASRKSDTFQNRRGLHPCHRGSLMNWVAILSVFGLGLLATVLATANDAFAIAV